MTKANHKLTVRSFTLFLFFSLFICAFGNAQNDTIRLINEDIIVGEIKSLSEGILTIETPYSDKDFKIEFNKVSTLDIERKCLIVLTDDRRRFGHVRSEKPGHVLITLEDGSINSHLLSEVIALQEVKDNFFQRFIASIDLSYNFTKANNSNQFTIAGNLKYNSETWIFEGSVSTLRSNRDDVERIQRTEANLEFIRLLPKKLYLFGEIPFLSNTEQALDARVSPSIGIGKLLASTNKLYHGLAVGFTWNIENYADSSLNKNSTEALISSFLTIYDIEDFDLNTDLKFYPSLSEKGRIRTDFNLNLKYDLPLDFYIKIGFSLNYDNKPAISGNEVDYIFTSGIGWDFN